MDTSENKIADEIWSVAFTYIKTVVETLREPFLILDAELRVMACNETFYRTFHTEKGATEGQLVYDLGNGQWNIPSLRVLLEKILPENTFFKDYTVEHDFPNIGKRIFVLNARKIFKSQKSISAPILLLAMEDVTDRKRLEDELRVYTEKLHKEQVGHTSELEKRVKELERLNEVVTSQGIKIQELQKQIEDAKIG